MTQPPIFIHLSLVLAYSVILLKTAAPLNVDISVDFDSSVPFNICANHRSRPIQITCRVQRDESEDIGGSDPFLRIKSPDGTQNIFELGQKRKYPELWQESQEEWGDFFSDFHPEVPGIYELSCVVAETDDVAVDSNRTATLEITVQPELTNSSTPVVYFKNKVEMDNGRIIDGQDVILSCDTCCDVGGGNHTTNFTCTRRHRIGNDIYGIETKTKMMKPDERYEFVFHKMEERDTLICGCRVDNQSTCEQKYGQSVYSVVTKEKLIKELAVKSATNIGVSCRIIDVFVGIVLVLMDAFFI